jgi:hypothetical protein
MMMKSLRGELTDTRNKDKFSLSNSKMVMAIAKSLEVHDHDSIKLISNVITPVLVNSLVSTVSYLSNNLFQLNLKVLEQMVND